MQIQYTIFMLIFYFLFIGISFALIPFAWIIGIKDKYFATTPQTPILHKIVNFGLFVPFGIPILLFDSFADCKFFWKNNFRGNLQSIIIQREISTVSHMSLREIMSICDQFSENKIKAIETKRLVKIFRRKFHANQNIQFLIFG